MDFSLLPMELFEKVAEYLGAEDLIACSMVNKQWQRWVDTDIIWKRQYTFHPNYFNKQVTKRISSTNHFETKRHVIRELQVGNNIDKGKYDLIQIDLGRLYCDNLLDLVDNVGNHWLFISCANNYLFENVHLIKVWNVNGEPTIHQTIETPLAVTNRLLYSQMTAVNNKLYYMVNDTLIAFEFSHPDYDLKVLFKVGYPDFEEFTSVQAMICKNNRIFGFVHTSEHASWAADPWVHVWAEEDCSLLYQSYSTYEVNQMLQVNHNHGGRDARSNLKLKVRDCDSLDNVVLFYTSTTMNLWGSHHSIRTQTLSVKLFNLESFQYTTLFSESHLLVRYFDVVNNIVFVFAYRQVSRPQELCPTMSVPILSCFSTDGRMIYDAELATIGNHNFHDISISNKGKEVLVLEPDGIVTVFDVFQRKEMCTFKILNYNSDNFRTVIKDNLIIVQQQKKKNTTQVVYDFTSGKRLYAFDQLQTVSPNQGIYRFAFNKNYRSPPKIFAIREPNIYYCKPCNGEIVMISFL